jgi:hypothetical protein
MSSFNTVYRGFIKYYIWTLGIYRELLNGLAIVVIKIINGLQLLGNKNSLYIQRALTFLLYPVYVLLILSAHCIAMAIYLLPAIVLAMTSAPPILTLLCLDFLTLMTWLATAQTPAARLGNIYIQVWLSIFEGANGLTTMIAYGYEMIRTSFSMGMYYTAALNLFEENYEDAQAAPPQPKSFAYTAINLFLAIPNFIISMPFRAANALDKMMEYTLDAKADFWSKDTFKSVAGFYRSITAISYFAIMQPAFIIASTALANSAYLAVPATGLLPAAAAVHVGASIWMGLNACFVAAMYSYNTKRFESQQKILTNHDPDVTAIKNALKDNNFAAILNIYKARPKLTNNEAASQDIEPLDDIEPVENAAPVADPPPRINKPLGNLWPTILEERSKLNSTFLDDINEEELGALVSDRTIAKECPISREMIEHPVYRTYPNGIRQYYEAINLLKWLQSSDIDPATGEVIKSFDDIHYDVEMKQALDAKVTAARDASQVVGTTIMPALLFDYSRGQSESQMRENLEQTQGWQQRCSIFKII